jgi:hypothetical protein
MTGLDAPNPPTPAALVRALVDAATWGLGVAVAVVTLGAVAALLLGTGLVGLKRGLFVGGFLTMGVALVRLRPRRGNEGGGGDRESKATSAGEAGSSGSADGRSPWGLRLFLGGVWCLFVSYLMEAVFGVGAA